jgi:hypothetical protein
MFAEFGADVTLMRVPGMRDVGAASGSALSHIALVLAMERYGWPYVIALSDDAVRGPGWWLFDRVFSMVRELFGETGFVSLGVDGVGEVQRTVVPRLLFAARDAPLSLAGVIWARRSIGAAHRYLQKLGNAKQQSDAPPSTGFVEAAQADDVLTWFPAEVIVSQAGAQNTAEIDAKLAALDARFTEAEKTMQLRWFPLFQFFTRPKKAWTAALFGS